MEKLNEIVELGNAQDLILGLKIMGGEDNGTAPNRFEIEVAEEND